MAWKWVQGPFRLFSVGILVFPVEDKTSETASRRGREPSWALKEKRQLFTW